MCFRGRFTRALKEEKKTKQMAWPSLKLGACNWLTVCSLRECLEPFVQCDPLWVAFHTPFCNSLCNCLCVWQCGLSGGVFWGTWRLYSGIPLEKHFFPPFCNMLGRFWHWILLGSALGHSEILKWDPPQEVFAPFLHCAGLLFAVCQAASRSIYRRGWNSVTLSRT